MAQNSYETKRENSEHLCRKISLESKRLKSSMEMGRQEGDKKASRGKTSVEM